MKTIKLAVFIATALLMISCNNQVRKQKPLNNQLDSVSYALGLDMVTNIKNNFGNDIDADLLIQGYLNGLDSTSLLIKNEDIREVLMPYFNKKREEQAEKMKAEQEKEALKEFGEYKKENETFIAENKSKPDVKTTSSGLQYIVIKEGKGESPKETSTVKVHYKGTTIKGEEFDSSYKNKEPVEFGVNQVIKGWTEGLQLMKTGAKFKFFIPQELAYGSQQRGEFIKPFSALIFEVELLEVK